VEQLVEIVVPLYLREYVKSESLRAKFYEKGRKDIPIKYCNKELYKKEEIREPDGVIYGWKSFKVTRNKKPALTDFLVELASGRKIVANEAHVGQRNVANINGQGIYNGNIAQHDRNNMMKQIKAQFAKALKDLPPLTAFPIRIRVYVFDTIMDNTYSNGQDWDMDNRFFPYGKAFADTLKGTGKIPDDNIYYITEPPHAIFVPVEDTQDRKLVIRIEQDTRPIIINNFLYKRFHGRL